MNSASKWILALAIFCLVQCDWRRAYAQPLVNTNFSKFEIRRVIEGPTTSAESESIPWVKPRDGRSHLQVSLVALLDLRHVQKVTVEKDSITGMDQIKLKLTGQGTLAFARITRENVGKELAIIVEGKIMTAPRIAQEIAGGILAIRGDYSPEEIRAIAKRLSGSIWRE